MNQGCAPVLYEWEPHHGDLIVPDPALPTPEPRVAVVTGGNHGIGAATAVALAAVGIDVLVTYLRLSPDPAADVPARYHDARGAAGDDVLAAIEPLAGRAATLEVDLTAPGAPAGVFDEAERRFGPVAILVNNASGWQADTFAPTGHGGPGPVAVGAGSVDRNLGVDARAAALLIAELARRHIARGATWGRIVGLTSGGPSGFPGEVSYGAAKAALENYTMSAAAELARYGITANTLHPPVTDTGWVTDDVRAFVASSTDHHHVATPAEVAEVVAWLCSDAARLVTGNVLRMR
jgi:3-oxoacyl-[acyl-carrier protein] reductase